MTNLDSIFSIAITPDSKQLVSGLRNQTLNIKIFDLSSGIELYALPGHTSWVNAVAITTDGKLLVSASSDMTLKLWDLHTQEELHTFTGHRYWVWAVAISPNGKWIVSSSWDKTLKVWDLQTGNVVANFIGESELDAVAIAPDGVTIIAGEHSGRLHFLRLEEC